MSARAEKMLSGAFGGSAVRLGEARGGIDQGVAIGAQRLDGGGADGTVHPALDEGGDQAVGDNASLRHGIGLHEAGPQMHEQIEGGEPKVFGGGHPAFEPRPFIVHHPDPLIALARVAYGGVSAPRPSPEAGQ